MIRLFLDGQLLSSIPTKDAFQLWTKYLRDLDKPIYNNGYVLLPVEVFPLVPGWYRCDMTPVLSADVPAELKAWELLLG